GYEILQETTRASDGSASLKATTLYAALERLEREGLVATDGDEVVSGRARRYYVLTEKGSAALGAEVAALERRARIAKERIAASAAAQGRHARTGIRGAFAAHLAHPTRRANAPGRISTTAHTRATSRIPASARTP